MSMGLLDRLKGLFRTNIELSSSESMQHSSDSVNQQPDVVQRPIEVPVSTSMSTSYESISSPSINKNSYDLGLAAGYTGRSIKDIESSMNRIELQMATKDWTELKMREQLERYDEILQQRLQKIEQALGIMQTTISGGQQIPQQFISRFPVTPRMEQIILAMKDLKEISYDDLAIRLDMNIDELRSLLSIMTKRTNVIERYRINGRGWLRYREEQPAE